MSTEADIVPTLLEMPSSFLDAIRKLEIAADLITQLRAERDATHDHFGDSTDMIAAARVSGTVAWLRNCHTEEDPAWVPCLKGDPGAIAFIATDRSPTGEAK